MCTEIVPNYACGHQDTAWLLYCNPTRKIFGQKHPPLKTCSGKDISKQEWNVFEPRCTKCEKRYRSGLERDLRRRKSSNSSTSTFGSGSFGARRRTTSLLEGIREAFRMEHSGSSKRIMSRMRERDSDSGSEKGDTTSSSDADSLQMLELRQTLTAVDGIESVGAIGVEPRIVGGFPLTGSSSSLDSLPCSPRTTAAPTADDYFS